MATNTRKVWIGLFLLVVSTALVLGSGQVGSSLPRIAGSIAALGLAAGALILGTSEDTRSV